MNNKKQSKRIVAMVLAVLMIGVALISVLPFFVNAAEESELSYPISNYTPGVPCPDPIPLLCIVVNFDANGNGVDDNADGSKAGAVQTESNALYGEQWCHFNHDVWAEMLFGEEGATLYNYYKLMSNGKFYFIPAPESYVDTNKKGVANDGVVEVVIKGKHLNTENDYVYYFDEAIKQIDEYVDFSVFDKDKNNRIDERELIISFINGGAELAQTSWNQLTSTEAFRSRAYYRRHNASSPLTYDADGYTVGYGGIFTTGSWAAQSSRADHATEFAVWAHELGHYLGAPDYYDTDKSATGADPGYHFTTGYYSLMGKSCHGSSPSHIDPFTMTSELTGYGFYKATDVMEDGVYTLYSKTSSEGEYNVIKINTPNPDEYYLIENRYVSSDYKGEAFDKYGIIDKQGIVIWHVDEGSYSSTAANNSNDKNDPTLAVYATNTKAMKRSNSTVKAAFGGSVDVFNPTEYVFPVSKTWHTSLTDAQAKQVENLRVEVISEPGEEMQIKVTGSYKLELDPEFTMFAYDQTKNSFTLKGKLKTLNYATLTSANIVVTEKISGNVVKNEALKFKSDYTYEVLCDGLNPGKEYTVNVVGETSFGSINLNVGSAFTKAEEVKQVTVTLVVNSDNYKTTTQKVNLGKALTIRFPLMKYGYTFAGWFLDEAYTQPYTPGVIDKEGDFTIYAKWVEGSAPVQTTVPTTATTAATTAPTTGDNVPTGGCGGASKGAEPMLLGGGIIAALLGASVGARSGKGKRREDLDESEK